MPLMDFESIKNTAIRAAYKAGEVLQKYFGHLEKVEKKGDIDLLTIADLESEKAVIATIKERFPDHSFLAEESGNTTGSREHCWIIDPLDGTTNFVHGLSLFSVSIAYALEGRVMVAVVLNPVTGELFTAVKGEGARLNGRIIRVSGCPKLIDSLLVTGFPYDLQTILDELMTRFVSCLRAAQGVRRLGSAALDLCFVACGRFDGFWEQNLKPWDTAAGRLVVEEAGGKVSDFSGMPYEKSYDPQKNQILATNGLIHDQLLSILHQEPSGSSNRESL